MKKKDKCWEKKYVLKGRRNFKKHRSFSEQEQEVLGIQLQAQNLEPSTPKNKTKKKFKTNSIS